jgi:hypothetical protein
LLLLLWAGEGVLLVLLVSSPQQWLQGERGRWTTTSCVAAHTSAHTTAAAAAAAVCCF